VSYSVVPDGEAAYGFINRFFEVGRTEQLKGLCQFKDGEIIAAVIFDDFNGCNIFMHCAAVPSKKWLTRHFLHEAFKHPFVTLGAHRITLWIEKSNIDSRRFAQHLGFTHEADLKQAGKDGGDIAIYRMFRQDCRYA
jgi:RimJ/RimL family protein N-acetyltransferase